MGDDRTVNRGSFNMKYEETGIKAPSLSERRCTRVSTAFYYGFPIEETLKVIRNAGSRYSEWAFVENTQGVDFKTVIQLLEQYELEVKSVHLPFSCLYKKGWEDFETSVKRSLELANLVGCTYLITHPPLMLKSVSYDQYMEECEKHFSFLSRNRSGGVFISSENPNNWENDDLWCCGNSLGSFLRIHENEEFL